MSATTVKTEDKLILADVRGRVNLGPDASAKAFMMRRSSDGDYVLTPMVHIPEREMWLWNDAASRASFERGVTEAEAGLGQETDFSAFLEEGDLDNEDPG